MAVIITDMDTPKCCCGCPIFYDYMYCPITSTHADFSKMYEERMPNCPLRSADELKQELFNHLFDNSDIDIGLAEISDIEAIIDKYCGKGADK